MSQHNTVINRAAGSCPPPAGGSLAMTPRIRRGPAAAAAFAPAAQCCPPAAAQLRRSPHRCRPRPPQCCCCRRQSAGLSDRWRPLVACRAPLRAWWQTAALVAQPPLQGKWACRVGSDVRPSKSVRRSAAAAMASRAAAPATWQEHNRFPLAWPCVLSTTTAHSADASTLQLTRSLMVPGLHAHPKCTGHPRALLRRQFHVERRGWVGHGKPPGVA